MLHWVIEFNGLILPKAWLCCLLSLDIPHLLALWKETSFFHSICLLSGYTLKFADSWKAAGRKAIRRAYQLLAPVFVIAVLSVFLSYHNALHRDIGTLMGITKIWHWQFYGGQAYRLNLIQDWGCVGF